MSADRPLDVSYELGGIKNALDTITRTLSEDRLASAQYRTDIRKELTAARDAIKDVGSALDMTKKDVAEMKPKVESLDQRALMSKGAANFAIILGKAAHIISAAVGGAIVLILDKLVFHK